MFHRLSESQVRTIGFIAGPIIVAAGTLIGHRQGGFALAATVALVSTVAIALLSRALTPPWFGRQRSQVYSLAILSGVSLGILAPETLWLPFFNRTCEHFGIPPLDLHATWERTIVLGVLAAAVIVLNFIWSRNPITPPSEIAPAEAESDFDDKGYRILRDEFSKYMTTQLDQYDRDVNWSDADYRELEAEVEIERQGALRPKLVNNIINAIHHDRTTRSFLVLGEPGSGKSVSLRRLCRKMYSQVTTTGIVPVYINLREWDGPETPSDQDIHAFILSHLKLQSGRSGIRFLENWYAPMFERGLFFFILDSFDEMPAVLDCDDLSNRLQSIAKGFDRFFNDLHKCRGILASRFFRQPRGFQGRRITIRPFSERQVRSAMKRWLLGKPLDATHVLQSLLRDKPEFSSIVQNPFSADLVAQFLSHSVGKLPENFFAVYEDYITKRLQEDIPNIKDIGLTSDQIIDGASTIAWEMYQAKDVGLDVEVNQLGTLVSVPNLEKLLLALRISRLARIGGMRIQRFSFVHRRFAEFFVVRNLIREHRSVPFESIPSDSRWRDCLVVYCGIASEHSARQLAAFAWGTAQSGLNQLEEGKLSASRPAIHCLRFLYEGFRGRINCLDEFHEDLSHALRTLIKSKNILTAKIAAEGLCITTDRSRESSLVIALSRRTSWIAETALKSCRHLILTKKRTKIALNFHLATLPSLELLKRYDDLSFGFSLTSQFKTLKIRLTLHAASLIGLWFVWVGIGLTVLIDFFRHLILSIAGESQSMPHLIAEGTMIFSVAAVPSLVELGIRRAPRKQSAKLLERAYFRLLRVFKELQVRPGYDTSVRVSLIVGHIMATGALSIGKSILYKSPQMREREPIELFWLLGALYAVTSSLQFWDSIKSTLRMLIDPKTLLAEVLKMISIIIRLSKFALFLFSAYLVTGLIAFGVYLAYGPKVFAAILVSLSATTLAIVISHLIFNFYRMSKSILSDWNFLRKAAIPESYSREWVYAMCEKLSSHWGRMRFLEALYSRATVIDDTSEKTLQAEWLTVELREMMGKLEEKWTGLEA